MVDAILPQDQRNPTKHTIVAWDDENHRLIVRHFSGTQLEAENAALDMLDANDPNWILLDGWVPVERC